MVKQWLVAVFVFVSAGLVVAQQSGFSRTVLQQVDLSVAGREAVTARAEFATPGATVGRHTHFGEEIGYVIEGTLTVEINGVSKAVKAGEAFAIPAGAPHNAHHDLTSTAGPATNHLA